jgi:ankyrin repeat protein
MNLDEPNLKTQLLDSASSGDLLKARRILESDPNIVDCRDNSGQTPLMLAAINSHFHVAEYLLDRGADILALDSFGQDALYQACQYAGNSRIIRLLLGRGCPVDRIVDGWTPLIAALSGAHEENVVALLESHPDVNYITPDSETPLSFAIVNGTVAIARLLIAAGANVNWIDAHETTPLAYAVSERDLEKVKLLLESGADPSHRDLYALNEAARSNSPEMVRLIAAYCRADQLKAAAHHAAAGGLVEVQALLLAVANQKENADTSTR